MSLADERRAIRNGVAASRASTFKSDLNALESSRRKAGGLLALERRGARVATRCAIWRICSGEVPQQPPTILTIPCAAQLAISAANSSGVSS